MTAEEVSAYLAERSIYTASTDDASVGTNEDTGSLCLLRVLDNVQMQRREFSHCSCGRTYYKEHRKGTYSNCATIIMCN